jgi:CRISPR-associated protein Cas2
MKYLLCYDITCPRRLGRVFRRVKPQGEHLQKSVFLLDLDARALASLLHDVDNLIDAGEDDIRLYPLDKNTLPEYISDPHSICMVFDHK